jgi:cytochrome c oxidase subunit II
MPRTVKRGVPALIGLATLWAAAAMGAPGREAAIREFEVTATKWAFSPERFEVFEGDVVRFIVRSGDSTHGFAIKRLKVKRKVPKDGSPVTIEVTPREPGQFEIACSEYCGRGHKKMKAVLVVRPRADGTR